MWKFHFFSLVLSEAFLSASLNNCVAIYLQQQCENDNKLYLHRLQKFYKSFKKISWIIRKISLPHSWQVCAEVQILSLEIDGSARDSLAFDQSIAADISTYAGWIIKNTSDPLWRNKLLLLPAYPYATRRVSRQSRGYFLLA